MMRYVGGKAKISPWVWYHLRQHADGRTTYIEPFVGSGAILTGMASSGLRLLAGDANLDLVLLWRELQRGWIPPHVDERTYEQLKTAEPSALRAFAGFGASWGGRWFGGYVDCAWDAYHRKFTKRYQDAARLELLRAAAVLRAVEFRHLDYAAWEVDAGCLVYCDPPYAGTVGYTGVPGKFDHERFWATARRWADVGASVVVSEQVAPRGWRVLSSWKRKAALRVSKGEAQPDRSEKLFVPE